MIRKEVPQAEYAHIGGSATWGCNFPHDIEYPGVTVLEDRMQFETPFGLSAPVRLLELNGKRILDTVFHGWNGLSPYDETPEERIFWVLQKAGVRFVIADGTVGAVNFLLDAGDIIIPSDFIDYTKRYSNIGRFTKAIVRSTNIVSGALKKILKEEAEKEFPRVYDRGVYGVYECPRLESQAEVQRYINDRCDIIGHTMMPEAILARAIGAVYAPVYMVSGVSWRPIQEDDGWKDDPLRMGKVILASLDRIRPEDYDFSADAVLPLDEELQRRISW